MKRLIGCLLLFACGTACAQGVTKWIDEKGRVHYGERMPPGAKEQAITRGTTSTVAGQAKPESKSAPAPASMTGQAPGATPPDPTRRNDMVKQPPPQQKEGEQRPESPDQAEKGRSPAEEKK